MKNKTLTNEIQSYTHLADKNRQFFDYNDHLEMIIKFEKLQQKVHLKILLISCLNLKHKKKVTGKRSKLLIF